MEFENIKELIKIFDKSSVTKIKISKEDFSIDLEKATAEVVAVAAPKGVQQIQAVQNTAVEVGAPSVAQPKQEQKGEIITSPMVGTFYKAPSPDSAPYAKVGDIIKKGQPLAIIEAMKIMNEIEAEFDCKILEVCVDDGQPVEYDMPLFRVEKA
ncbi:MAG: acetyl-CoA carboxylase biotin carboxyl carrier protein [Campylobacteraceae bacterium]|jgi:acetyl-CoA carboxylase biotin carboxyl carrier protein|nr:acetyl-CoA carboxylase biotin carboxyl carrier protein [Campylobacteraceae bacterium]